MSHQRPIQGLVSIVIPTYNRYDLLIHCIQSCIHQTYPHIEIIVVDDCSTDPRYRDGSLEKLPKTNVIHLPVNQRQKYQVKAAQGMTRQEGMDRASGEWIAFLDDDDFFLSHKIETQLDQMNQKGFKFSSSNMIMVTHRKVVDNQPLDMEHVGPYFTQELPSIFNRGIIERSNYINNSTVMVHRTVIDKVGRFRPEKYEDWEYWKRVLNHVDCLYLSEPLVYYTTQIEKHYVYQ